MSDSAQTVIVYGADWCPPCHVARGYLAKHGISFEYRNVEEKDEWMRQAVQKSGQNAIPVLDFGNDRIVVGFDRPKIDAALGLA